MTDTFNITPGTYLRWYGEFLNMAFGGRFTIAWVFDCVLRDIMAQYEEIESAVALLNEVKAQLTALSTEAN